MEGIAQFANYLISRGSIYYCYEDEEYDKSRIETDLTVIVSAWLGDNVWILAMMSPGGPSVAGGHHGPGQDVTQPSHYHGTHNGDNNTTL